VTDALAPLAIGGVLAPLAIGGVLAPLAIGGVPAAAVPGGGGEALLLCVAIGVVTFAEAPTMGFEWTTFAVEALDVVAAGAGGLAEGDLDGFGGSFALRGDSLRVGGGDLVRVGVRERERDLGDEVRWRFCGGSPFVLAELIVFCLFFTSCVVPLVPGHGNGDGERRRFLSLFAVEAAVGVEGVDVEEEERERDRDLPPSDGRRPPFLLVLRRRRLGLEPESRPRP
jgi:hypothetical protein